MAYELRRPQFNFSGVLSAGISALDTSISSLSFPNLPTTFTATQYMPLTIANDSQGKSEIVWVTGHASASTSVTVVRGREGTTALSFSAGDVVRCTPTLRDVVSDVANRAALPSDPHIGLRHVLLDEQLVLERTSTGWSESSFKLDNNTRKHHWAQAAAPLTAPGSIVSGLGGTQTGTTGTIATMAGGNLTLNRAGLWSLTYAMYSGNFGNRNQGLELRWSGGAFTTGNNLYQISGVFSGGNGLQTLTWCGMVSAAQAAIPIGCWVSSTVSLTNCQYDVAAEYLGA